MAKAKKADKVVLERIYVIPLRKGYTKVPRYKKTKRAVKDVRAFLIKHLKVYDKDFKKVKISKWLNEEIWYRGARNPPSRIRVKIKKYDSGLIEAEPLELHTRLKFRREKEEKREKEVEKIKKVREEEKKKAEEEKKTVEQEDKEKKVSDQEEEKKIHVLEQKIKEPGLEKREIEKRIIKPKEKKQKVLHQRVALEK